MEAFQSVTTCPQNGMIDARYLHLEAQFFELEKNQSDYLLGSFVIWCESFFSEQFVVDWYWKERNVKVETLLERIRQEGTCYAGIEGAVRCQRIYNKKTFRAYKKELWYPITGGKRDTEIFEDYFDFYRERVAQINNKQIEWKDAILSFFNEPNRIAQTTIQHLEIEGYVIRTPYFSNADLFNGEIGLSIPIFCLNKQVSSVAERFAIFLNEISCQIANMNGRVAVTPMDGSSKCSGHMKYFGNESRLQLGPVPNGYFPIEWYPYYYICGAEWFNVISPLAQAHLPMLFNDTENIPEILVKKHSNGSVNLKLQMDPDLVDVSDLRKMRDLLYNGLYPGMKRMVKKYFLDPQRTGLLSKPRMKWEILPIHEEEIIETEDEILFVHAPCKDDNV